MFSSHVYQNWPELIRSDQNWPDLTTNDPKGPELTREDKKSEMKEMARIDQNIAKDTTDPGVDCFNQ